MAHDWPKASVASDGDKTLSILLWLAEMRFNCFPWPTVNHRSRSGYYQRGAATRSLRQRGGMTAQALRTLLHTVGAKTLHIEPGSPWENGCNERFNGKLRDECLNQEIFHSLKEAQLVIDAWREEYNRVPLHSSLGSTTRTSHLHTASPYAGAAPRMTVKSQCGWHNKSVSSRILARLLVFPAPGGASWQLPSVAASSHSRQI